MIRLQGVFTTLIICLASVLILVPIDAHGQTSQCSSGPLAGQTCQQDSDCHACIGGASQGQLCSSSAECTGTCSLGGGPQDGCLNSGECPDEACNDNGSTCQGATGLSFCSPWPTTAPQCVEDSNCGQCALTGSQCDYELQVGCLQNVCNGASSCNTVALCETINLPVEMTSFEALVDGPDVLLAWTTATEENNAGFAIQTRTGAADWADIDFVEGHGSTSSPKEYSFRIAGLPVGTHIFRLKQIDFDGAFEFSEEVEAVVEVPGQFVLEPAYPNPFNPTTTIRFAVATSQQVTVTLHDAAGKEVRQLYSGTPDSDVTQTIVLDGSGLASGAYHVRLQGEGFVGSQRVTLVK